MASEVDQEQAYQLFVAARDGNEERISALLKLGVDDLNCTDRVNLTPLSVAVQSGHHGVVKLLLDANAQTEIKDTTGEWTALHYAASEGKRDMVTLLLQAGANPGAKDNVKDTPLNEAVRHAHVDATRLLLEASASVFARSTAGIDALELAVKGKAKEAPELLAMLELAAEREAAAFKAQRDAAAAAAAVRPPPPSTRMNGTSESEQSAPSPANIAQATATPAAEPEHLAPQSRVVIIGLSSRADLNGSAGVVIGWHAASSRYMVRPDDGGASVKLRPECLRSADEQHV